MGIFKSSDILGINARNLLYIKPLNPAKAIRLADDKIHTKRFLEVRGIPVPKLIKVISSHEELENFNFDSLPNSFALKPNCGFGGEGIIPVASRENGFFITVSGEKIDKKTMYDHILDILDGRFSISNIEDSAFFEQLIIPDESLGKYSYGGLPDVRIIVYNLVPVMAMLRLPTKESNGKANLHLGAVGVGLNLATGKPTYIVQKNKIIEEIPGIGKIDELRVPFWDEILLMASKIQVVTNLGYLAVDIAIDKNLGPVLLEINARAGLSVQTANLAPLRKRLNRIEGLKVVSPEKGVRIAKDMFGSSSIQKTEEQKPGKKIIGKHEEIELILKNGKRKLKALVDPSQERSTLDSSVAEELKLLDSPDYNDEQSTLKVKFTLKDERIQTVVDVDKLHHDEYKIVIGARDLKGFLIDPSFFEKKTSKIHQKPIIKKRIKTHFEIDQEIVSIDNKIKLLFHLRPTNLTEEQKKFLAKFSYNPQFIYPDLRFDSTLLRQRLAVIEDRGSPLDKIFVAKKDELLKKISLLESIGDKSFTERSEALFERPSKELVKECENLLLETQKFTFKDEEKIKSLEVKKRFEKVFKEYGLNNWQVKIKDEMVTDCIAGKSNTLFIRKEALFSEKRIEKLIIHEIETHILTAENGKNQPFELFNRGLADYLETQEGLAIYNVTTQMESSIHESFKAIALVIAIDEALRSSFVKTFEKVLSYGIPMEQALRVTLKVKRGLTDTSKRGTFTKDIIYYSGYKKVKRFIEEGGDLKDLYIGKLNLEDLDMVKKIKGLVAPKYLPKWLK